MAATARAFSCRHNPPSCLRRMQSLESPFPGRRWDRDARLAKCPPCARSPTGLRCAERLIVDVTNAPARTRPRLGSHWLRVGTVPASRQHVQGQGAGRTNCVRQTLSAGTPEVPRHRARPLRWRELPRRMLAPGPVLAHGPVGLILSPREAGPSLL